MLLVWKRMSFCLSIFFLLQYPLHAQVYLTKDEALKLYFPPPLSVERKTIFLTDEQIEYVQRNAKAKVESKIVPFYVGKQGKEINGYAFIETHIVRTMPETFMIILNPDSTIRLIEMLAFYEPEDYLPPKRWLEQYRGKGMSHDLWLKRGIHNIIGATMTAQALTDAVRKYLVIFELVVQREK